MTTDTATQPETQPPSSPVRLSNDDVLSAFRKLLASYESGDMTLEAFLRSCDGLADHVALNRIDAERAFADVEPDPDAARLAEANAAWEKTYTEGRAAGLSFSAAVVAADAEFADITGVLAEPGSTSWGQPIAPYVPSAPSGSEGSGSTDGASDPGGSSYVPGTQDGVSGSSE